MIKASPHPTTERKLVTLVDAAAQLNMSLAGMRSWIIRRQIDYVKIGNRVNIRQSTIDDIIDRGTVKATVRTPGEQHQKLLSRSHTD
jgi:hypothetical protein